MMPLSPPFPSMQQYIENVVATSPICFHANLYQKHGGLHSHVYTSMQKYVKRLVVTIPIYSHAKYTKTAGGHDYHLLPCSNGLTIWSPRFPSTSMQTYIEQLVDVIPFHFHAHIC